MAWDELALPTIDFDLRQSLPVALWWVERHCIVPDGFRRGQQFELVPWQATVFLQHYRVKPTAKPGQLSTAFAYRRSQVILPQKAGKAPFSAAQICLEGVGPALFKDWAEGGEVYDCRDHGCGCGWKYEYSPGEAMGQRWPTPLIQITATSEDQTANIYTALRPMIDDGPLSPLIPHTGESFIRLPNDGRIDPVTSNGRSRLGQRVTFCPWDEVSLYLRQNKMFGYAEAVYDTQKRGLTAMGGRGLETANAWDPTQDSAALDTANAAKKGGIYRYHPMAPRGLSYANKAERRKIHRIGYDGCPWVDLDAIEGDAAELLGRDPGQAERFYGNRPVAGEGVAFDIDIVKSLARPRKVEKGATIVIGADGARFHDAMAVVACEIKTGYFWPIGIWERPEDADENYEHPRDKIDGAVREAFNDYNVWRMNCDTQYIEHLVEGWQNEFGDKRVLPWLTSRPRAMCWAVRDLEDRIASSSKALKREEEPSFTYSGDPTLTRHFANARKRTESILDDKERPMHTLSKESGHSRLWIDGSIATVLADEARGLAIGAGVYIGENVTMPEARVPEGYRPGWAPPTGQRNNAEPVGPMGSMS